MDITQDYSRLFTPQAEEFSQEELLDRVQELEEQVALQNIDRLTGVLSADAFFAQVKRILQEYPLDNFVMWRFDIDKFQTVNNLFGVEEGNRLLVFCADYLQSTLARERNVALGRMGGDVFCGIAPYHESHMTSGEAGQHWVTANSSFSQLEQAFSQFRPDFRFSVTVGFYQIQHHNDPLEILYSRTLAASKACKENRERFYAFFDEKLSIAMEEKQIITAEMHKALEEGQFTVYLQPKVRLSDLSLVGAEALVRWIHPEKGRIPPDSFVPIFEENGFITKLDLYVLRRCCAYIQSWMRQGMTLIPLSVNLSQADLSSPGLPFRIQAILEEYKVDAKYIHLEITESAYANDMEQVHGVTQAFRDLGFHLEMDDFGKGYSSLNMIAELPIDTLKLDMGFLQGEQEGSGKVIRFVTALARHMELTTVAEGIETQEQLAFLRSINCDCGQGFLFSKPLAKADFDVFMRQSALSSGVKQVTKLERALSEPGHWNTKELWKADSAFSKMFNVFPGVLGICELNLLRMDFRLTRYNSHFVDMLQSNHQAFQEFGDGLLDFLHPEDTVKVQEMLTAVTDPKNWAKDFGLQTLDLRFRLISAPGEEASYIWVRATWKLAEFQDETRTYVLTLQNTQEFQQQHSSSQVRLEQLEELERQLAIFSRAGMAGTATFRFRPKHKGELLYANREFMFLHSMDDQFEQLKFPLDLSDILPLEPAKHLENLFLGAIDSKQPRFQWRMTRPDNFGTVRNVVLTGRLSPQGDGMVAEVVLSSLNQAAALESQLLQCQENYDAVLTSTESTLMDFQARCIHYGSDLQLAYALPASVPFLPEEGFPNQSIFHPESYHLLNRVIGDLLLCEGKQELELWMRHPDYVEYSLRHCTLFSQVGADGRISQVRGITRDITLERYGSSNVSVGEIASHIPDGLMVFHHQRGKLSFANDTFYEIVGMSREKLADEYKNYPLLLISEEVCPVLALPEIAQEGQHFLREARLNNHAMRWIAFSGVRRGDYVYGTVRDVTEQKKVEIQLDRETNFNQVLNSIADELLFRVDIPGKTVHFTGKAASSFDLPDQPIPFPLERLHQGKLVAAEHEGEYQNMAEAICRGEEQSYELALVNNQGLVVWYRFEYRILQEAGELAFAIGKGVNIDYQVELLDKLERDSTTGFYNGAAMKLRTNQILHNSFTQEEKLEDQSHAFILVSITPQDVASQENLSLLEREDMTQQLARLIGSKFRDTDIVGRISPQVFGIFMQNITMPSMPLQKISDLYLDFQRYNTMVKSALKISVEIRCAYAKEDGVNYPSLLENAKLIPLDMEIP